jgi:DNA-directed RNA polymerase specialized sigma24 family protein
VIFLAWFFLSETASARSIRSRQQDVEAVEAVGKKPQSSKTYATDEEIEAAFAALSLPELAKLGRFADLYARALEARGAGVSGDDLVQEAITRTFTGERRWPTSVRFSGYLMMTVRSIADASMKKLKYGAIVGTDPTKDEISNQLADKLMLKIAHQERIAAEGVAAEVERIEQLFDGDERVLLLIEALKDQMSGPDIQEWLKLTKTEYETAMKRLRRGARRKGRKG